MLTFICAVVLPVLAALALVAQSYLVVPTWVKDDEHLLSRWHRRVVWTAIVSALVGVTVLGSMLLIASDRVDATMFAAPTVGTVLLFVLIQSFATDGSKRLVDRKMLRVALLLVALVQAGVWVLAPASVDVPIYLLVSLITAITFFIPALGRSDARALLISVVGTFPLVNIGGLESALVILGAVSIAVAVTLSVRMYGKRFLSSMATASLPMVPMITGSFLLVMVVCFGRAVIDISTV